MKLNLTPLYVISFLCLVFLVHELHDWAHTLMARLISGSWGPRGFDSWGFDPSTTPSNGQQALAILAGPVINLLLLYMGWALMANEDATPEQSVGISLVLACLPMAMIFGAFTGGGDIINGLHLLFTKTNHTTRLNPRLFTFIGLLITVFFCVPALIRAFILLPGGPGKVVFFPIFLLAPIWIDKLVEGNLLNRLLVGVGEHEAYFWVLGWTILMLIGWLVTRRSMAGLLIDIFASDDD
jgi:hypothetical protein